MDNIDKIMQEIKSMDKARRNELLSTLEGSISEKQQENLKRLLSGKEGRAALERELEKADIDKAIKSIKNGGKVNGDYIAEKLKELLG